MKTAGTKKKPIWGIRLIYKKFRGAEPEIESMLQRKGLI